MQAETFLEHSIALEADARHVCTDTWTSADMTGGLLIAQLTGWLWLDAGLLPSAVDALAGDLGAAS